MAHNLSLRFEAENFRTPHKNDVTFDSVPYFEASLFLHLDHMLGRNLANAQGHNLVYEFGVRRART